MQQIYVFSGVISAAEFRDDTGFFAKIGLRPGINFELTFKLDKMDRYQPPGKTGYYTPASFVVGTVKAAHIGNGMVIDDVSNGDPCSYLNTPCVPRAYSLSLQDTQHAFSKWVVGHTVQAHYEYKNGNQLSSMDLPMTIKLISP